MMGMFVCSVAELPQQRVYVGYSVYTKKGMLTVIPRPPEFESKSVCYEFLIFFFLFCVLEL